MFKRNLAIGQALLPLLVLEATITGFVVVDHLTHWCRASQRKMLSPLSFEATRRALADQGDGENASSPSSQPPPKCNIALDELVGIFE